jgi:NTP pyrophosphatase (non-canonical NTP hydrolase)
MEQQTYQALSILQEECAEIIQAVSKCFRFGIDSQYNNTTNKQRLEEELGDLLAMIEILKYQNVINGDNLHGHKLNKFEKLRIWSTVPVDEILETLK